MFSSILFWIFAILIVGSAIMVITRKNPVHSALWLVLTFFSVASLYVIIKAHFLAAVQLLIYVGAILVLYVFVIMMSDVKEKKGERYFHGQKILACFVGLIFSASFIYALSKSFFKGSKGTLWARTHIAGGNTEAIGDVLYTKYLLPFEIVSILLLVAIVGAIVLAKKD